MRRLRVLHVTEYARGGVASHLQEIVEAQAERFGTRNIAVILPKGHVDDLPTLEPMLRPFDPGPNRLVATARVARAAMQLARTLRPDVVHAHSTFAGAAVRLLPRRLLNGAKIVYCPHGWSFDMEGSALQRHAYALVERLLSPRCEKIIAVSKHEHDLALAYGLREDRLEIAVNGISADIPQTTPMVGSNEHGLRLLFVGRPVRQKGLDILLEAMTILDRDDVVLDLIGPSPSDIATPVRNVVAHGWLPRELAQAFIVSSDALVMPSRWEALGIAAIEAMRAGKPVIASDSGALPEVVADGLTGLIVRSGDPVALADTLRGLTKSKLRTMGSAGRQRFFDHFTIEAQERRIAEIYDELVPHS